MGGDGMAWQMSGTRGRVSSVLVPAYFHADALEWADLTDERLKWVVFNIANGPGTVRDRAWAAVAHRLAANGVELAGYIDTSYGERPPEDIEDEVTRYRKWYGVRTAFMDQVSAIAGHVPRYCRAVTAAQVRGAECVVLNHGIYPDPAYARLADMLVTFEGPWSAYQHFRPPAWAARVPAETFCHLVYAAPQAVLARALARAGRGNAGVVYVTDRAGANPWSGLPDYFDREMDLVYPDR
ncbi:hypothetical protein FXF69_18070 [Actinomadura chibensis]|uniref:Spherulation-specific family 4 protein n=2 Tax=Actinomadura chibensis TaxID=392828 RepID=A0A5D0NLT0_9ACTN|nr:hypothetical protein FXF69_18070 [Actinomadura chibensis]